MTPNEKENLTMKKLAELQLKLKAFLAKEVGHDIDSEDFPYEFFFSLKEDESQMAAYSGNGCAVCTSIEIVRWIIMTGIKHADEEQLENLDTEGVH